jgi:hypothetical protein
MDEHKSKDASRRRLLLDPSVCIDGVAVMPASALRADFFTAGVLAKAKWNISLRLLDCM